MTTESVDGLYSPSSRGKAIEIAGKRFQAGLGFRGLLLDVQPMEVCKLLTGAGSIIEAALEFDERHAKARLHEADAHPDREIPNPYSIESQESLKTVVRTVLSSAVGRLATLMPPDWYGSRAQASQCTAAQTTLLRRIDEEYSRRRLEFDLLRAASHIKLTAPPGPTTPSPDAAAAKRSRSGRQTGALKKREWVELALAQLRVHHKFDGKMSEVATPIGCRELGRAIGIGPNKARRFFQQIFGSHKRYQAFCCNKPSLDNALRAVSGDIPPSMLWTSLREDWLIHREQKMSHQTSDNPRRNPAAASS